MSTIETVPSELEGMLKPLQQFRVLRCSLGGCRVVRPTFQNLGQRSSVFLNLRISPCISCTVFPNLGFEPCRRFTVIRSSCVGSAVYSTPTVVGKAIDGHNYWTS